MENKYGISLYEFEREIQAFCPLGNDYYTCNIVVQFIPKNTIFDFCEIDNFIKSLGGANAIVEKLVNAVYFELFKYDPDFLEVKGVAKSNTHFPVTVTKSSNYPF